VLSRLDHIHIQKMDCNHEDQCMNRSGGKRGLARCKDTAASRGQGQKHTRRKNEEENGNQEVEHLYTV